MVPHPLDALGPLHGDGIARRVDGAMPWNQADVTSSRACLGQLYFHVPGGTKYGQYWLNVKFAQSVVRVPFRLLTEEEEETLGKNFGDIKKQVDAAFRKKVSK